MGTTGIWMPGVTQSKPCAASLEAFVRFPVAIQVSRNKHYAHEIEDRGNRHDFVRKPIREEYVGNIAPTRQPVDQCRQRALETVCHVDNTDRENDAHRPPEVTVALARDAAIDNVHNAARREEEYQRMGQLRPINPIHISDTTRKSTVSRRTLAVLERGRSPHIPNHPRPGAPGLPAASQQPRGTEKSSLLRFLEAVNPACLRICSTPSYLIGVSRPPS
jgi:hypothetical protein